MNTIPEFAFEQTLVIIKPDGIQRALIGEIIKRYEQTGLKMVGLKFLVPTAAQARDHYMVGGEEWLENIGKKAAAAYEAKGQKSPYTTFRENGLAILDANAKYLSSGPVVAMIWQGPHAIELVRKITGSTQPLSSDVGTIRGDYTFDSYQLADTAGRSIRNLIHASGDPEEAKKEIALWFAPNEVCSKYRLISEQMLYDVNLDGILE